MNTFINFDEKYLYMAKKDKHFGFQYGFPLFTSQQSKSVSIKQDKIRISDIWSFWDYIIKVYGKRTNKAQGQFISSLLEQAKYFYVSAESAPLKSKPLLYYYSFLNLAKIVINLETQLGNTVEYNHGLKVDITDTTNFLNAQIEIQQLGSTSNKTGKTTLSVAKVFFDYLGDQIAYTPRTPYPLNIHKLFESCIGIHRTFCETYNKKEHFFRLDRISPQVKEPYVIKNGHDFIYDAIIDSCDDSTMQNLTSKGYNIHKDNKQYVLHEKISLGRRYNVTRSDWYRLSNSLLTKGLWTYTDGNEYRIYISSNALPMTEASIIYCIMFFFGSITRYHPYLFERILSDKELWLVSEFLNTQPTQFLFYITSKVIGNYIYKSRHTRL